MVSFKRNQVEAAISHILEPRASEPTPGVENSSETSP